MASLSEIMSTAANGPLLEAVLIPLTNQGKLRVTYNWLYSALNCDPNDQSDFVWVLNKLDDTHVSMSPKVPYAGRTLYTSVRDDWSWYLQVQAPFSADWITAVGRNEQLAINGADLLIISLQGWNNQYVAVNSQLSQHDNHSGYRLQSIGSSDSNARSFFVGITQVQPGLHVPMRSELTEEHVTQALVAAGLPSGADTVSWLLKAVR